LRGHLEVRVVRLELHAVRVGEAGADVDVDEAHQPGVLERLVRGRAATADDRRHAAARERRGTARRPAVAATAPAAAAGRAGVVAAAAAAEHAALRRAAAVKQVADVLELPLE